MFPVFWRVPGPGPLPLDSGCGDFESYCDFARVASVAERFVSEVIFLNLAYKKKVVASKTRSVDWHFGARFAFPAQQGSL